MTHFNPAIGILYDAFAPHAQPEMWREDLFRKMFQSLRLGGILVTYCAKGDVKRSMLRIGFEVGKLKGPPGKREMIRASKL